MSPLLSWFIFGGLILGFVLFVTYLMKTNDIVGDPYDEGWPGVSDEDDL